MSELIGSHCAALVLFRVENKSRIRGGTFVKAVVPVFVTVSTLARVFCSYLMRRGESAGNSRCIAIYELDLCYGA